MAMMKIEKNEYPKKIKFKELNLDSVFEYEGDLYIKVELDYFNSIRIFNFSLQDIHPDELVYVVREINIKYSLV